MLKPEVTRSDFDQINKFIDDHPAILHVEFTPVTPCPGTPLYEEKKDQILTRDWQVYDMQHFVVKTALPQEEIYRMIVQSYSKIVFRIARRKGWKLFFKQWGGWKYRMLHGVMANRTALGRAQPRRPRLRRGRTQKSAAESQLHDPAGTLPLEAEDPRSIVVPSRLARPADSTRRLEEIAACRRPRRQAATRRVSPCGAGVPACPSCRCFARRLRQARRPHHKRGSVSLFYDCVLPIGRPNGANRFFLAEAVWRRLARRIGEVPRLAVGRSGKHAATGHFQITGRVVLATQVHA